MLAALVDARRKSQNIFLAKARRRDNPVERGFALRQGAGLVHDQRVDLVHTLDRRCIAEQHALRRCTASGRHDRHRRCQAQRARTCNDQHRHCIDETKYPTRVRPQKAPPEQRQQRDANDNHDKVTGHNVGQTLHRRARTLRLGDHLHNLREHRLGADFLSMDHQAATGVERGANHLVPGPLRDRHRLAGEHRFVHRAFAFHNDAIDRHFFAGTHP